MSNHILDSAEAARRAWVALPQADRLRKIDELSPVEQRQLDWEWWLWARDGQWPPAWNWQTFLLLSGRGYGKTRTGAEWVRLQVESGARKRLALVARTSADIRDVIIEGQSGILATARPDFLPHYEPSKRRVTWPNGAIATTYSADEPDLLRGPEHDGAYVDELASWRYLDETWQNLLLGLRLGDNPQVVVTTTPRPLPLLKKLVADPLTAVTRGSTYENLLNLAPTFKKTVLERYEGTRLGRQEIGGEILEDTPGALWNMEMIEKTRINNNEQVQKPVDFVRVVVAIDPAVTAGEDSDDTGIVVVGKGRDGRGYVISDLTCHESPLGWANVALRAYDKYSADRIVAEVNNGGDMVETTIRTVRANVPYSKVHASRGKTKRAEPISSLYEQGKISHIGQFPQLEDQMCTYVPDDNTQKSPDRLDALVWGMTELFGRGFVDAW